MKKVLFNLTIKFVWVQAMYCMNFNENLENNKNFVKIVKNQKISVKNIVQMPILQEVKKVPITILYSDKGYLQNLDQGMPLIEEARKLEKKSLEGLSQTAFSSSFQDLESNKAEKIRSLLYCSIIDINEENNDGETPLFLAVKNQDEKIVRLLLKWENIDVDKTVNGISPLLIGVFFGLKKIVSLLLKNGADFNYKFNNEMTAYDIAEKNNDLEIMLLLDFYKYMVNQKLVYLLFFKLKDVKLEQLKNKIPSKYILEYLLFIAQNKEEEKFTQEMYNKHKSLFS